MNYYYRRYVAVLLAAFLLAAAAPFALAQEKADKKDAQKVEEAKPAKESSTRVTAAGKVLCSTFLANSLLFSPSAAEFCARHGVTAVSVFPNGSAASAIYGGETNAEYEALEKAYDHWKQCLDDEAKAKEEVKRLEEALKNAKSGKEKEEIEQKLKDAKEKLKNISEELKDAKGKLEEAKKEYDTMKGWSDKDWAAANDAAVGNWQALKDEANSKAQEAQTALTNAQNGKDDAVKNAQAAEQQAAEHKKKGEELEKAGDYEGAQAQYALADSANKEASEYWDAAKGYDQAAQQAEAEREKYDKEADYYGGMISQYIDKPAEYQSYVMDQANANIKDLQGTVDSLTNAYNDTEAWVNEAQTAYDNYNYDDAVAGYEAQLALAEQNAQNAAAATAAAASDYNGMQGLPPDSQVVPPAAPATESGDQGGETPAVSCDDEVAACKAKCNKDDKDYKDCIKKCKALC